MSSKLWVPLHAIPQARLLSFKINPGLPHWLSSKEFACNAGDPHLIPGSGNTLEKGMATHSSILAWRISWTEQPGGLQSMGSQRHRQNWSNWACTNLLYHEIPQKALKSLPQHHSSKASILGHSAFLIVQHSYPCTHHTYCELSKAGNAYSFLWF